ncbi:hypothetical protein [Microbacterium sp. No. 7]|uniref:hypothetical protein n=1 Tax=Microbacterium sp. No. 7 TaxID=1714373 RepID=UPI0006D19D6D|nr:hypothetical protein [Microbacterium sp. No. 7]ALJ19060.1 hypothetical protein AOA12_03720 [Microbacterium sp. No. 7]
MTYQHVEVLTSRDIIPLADWARTADVRGSVAANKAKQQTIPAFRLRDRWMIAVAHREPAL